MVKLEKVCVYKKTLNEAHEIIHFLYGMVLPSDLSEEQKKDIERITIRLKSLSKPSNKI